MHHNKLVLSVLDPFVISSSLRLVPCTVPVMRLSTRFWLVSFIHSFFFLSVCLFVFLFLFMLSSCLFSLLLLSVFFCCQLVFYFLAFYRYFVLTFIPLFMYFYVSLSPLCSFSSVYLSFFQFVCLSFCLSFIFSIFLSHLEHAN